MLDENSESPETVNYNKKVKYAKKLIKGIEADIEKEMVNIDGELCYPQKWIDVSLLCSVVREIL